MQAYMLIVNVIALELVDNHISFHTDLLLQLRSVVQHCVHCASWLSRPISMQNNSPTTMARHHWPSSCAMDHLLADIAYSIHPIFYYPGSWSVVGSSLETVMGCFVRYLLVCYHSMSTMSVPSPGVFFKINRRIPSWLLHLRIQPIVEQNLFISDFTHCNKRQSLDDHWVPRGVLCCLLMGVMVHHIWHICRQPRLLT